MSKGVLVDLSGQRFGRLLVSDRNTDDTRKGTFWNCKCDCGEITSVDSAELRRKNRKGTRSCGCLRIDIASELNRKYNDYDLTGVFGVGYIDNSDIEFYFDLEDFDKIKDFCWNVDSEGYIYTTDNVNGTIKYIRMHRYLLDTAEGMITDHINRCRIDNRKSNLREVTPRENAINITRRKDNKSGYTGVHFHERDQLWIATINIEGCQVEIIRTHSKSEAVSARLDAEFKHYGEYSPNY